MNSIEQQRFIRELTDPFKKKERIANRQNKALKDIHRTEDKIYADIEEMVRVSGLCENEHSVENATRLATNLILYAAETIIRRMEGSMIV